MTRATSTVAAEKRLSSVHRAGWNAGCPAASNATAEGLRLAALEGRALGEPPSTLIHDAALAGVRGAKAAQPEATVTPHAAAAELRIFAWTRAARSLLSAWLEYPTFVALVAVATLRVIPGYVSDALSSAPAPHPAVGVVALLVFTWLQLTMWAGRGAMRRDRGLGVALAPWLPVTRPLVRGARVARALYGVAAALRDGVPLEPALAAVGAHHAVLALRHGEPLSDALFGDPALAEGVPAFAAGEGCALADRFDRAAEFVCERALLAARAQVQVLVPLLIVVLVAGVVVVGLDAQLRTLDEIRLIVTRELGR